MSERVTSSVLIGAGLACVACEMWTSHDYMMAREHGWTSLVAANMVVTGMTALLPVGADQALRRRLYVYVAACWLMLPVMMSSVFMAAIARNGSVIDADETSRLQIAETIKIAHAEESEAIAQLVTDKALVAKNCDVYGPKCTKAKVDQAATEVKLAGARATLKVHSVTSDDSLAKRLTAILPLSKEQVQLWQPLLMPIALAIGGFLMISIGLSGFRKQAPKAAELPKAEPQPAAEPAPVAAPVPKRGTPQLTVVKSGDTLVGTLTRLIEKKAKARVAPEDLYRAYATQVPPDQRLSPKEFGKQIAEICEKAGIKLVLIDGKPVLMGVRLVAHMQQVATN
jgi:hypothetical protein